MLEHVFPGTSEMARRMRALDWSRTPLGPVEEWPPALRNSVSTCLDCAFPIVLWWGPELAILYNDEYRAMLGPAKHPGALGKPGAKVWSEIWDVIEPMLLQVMERAEPTRSRDLLLHIDRQGYPEEAYFSFSYSPIHMESSRVGGIFCPVIETTEKVIGERRLRTLRDLAAECKGAESETAVCQSAARILAGNPRDVPFCLLYRIDRNQSLARLEATAGIDPGTVGAPQSLQIAASLRDPWSLGAVSNSGQSCVLRDLDEQFDALPTGAWQNPPHTAVVLPVLLPGQDLPHAVLVAAVSPMRALDADYRTFFELVATQIASGFADAQALEAERQRTAALAEIDRAKTAFFSNVSHEFRTPLTLMLGQLEEVIGDTTTPLPGDVNAALTVAHRNSLRLLKLVNTLLDFSRIEAGRVEASYELTDLSLLTAELASVFRSAIEKAGLRLLVDCPALRGPAYIDRDMWEKIVLNLLSNAFKFTFEGQIVVALREHEHEGSIELSVTDSGVGIPAMDLPKIFQRFHRVTNTRSRTHEGTGIGLALVQELVRLHGGKVGVRSEEGRGTSFTVVIPSGSAHLPAERIHTARRLEPTGLGAIPFVEEARRWLPSDGDGSMAVSLELFLPPATPRSDKAIRVLVADDNADMRDYLRHLLERTYRVEAVADGEQALERVRADPPDLVLTDVMMPRLDGFGLLAAIRADERTRSLPVIMLSARAGEEAQLEGLRAGADAYLCKPFSARELLVRVASQLELAELRRDAEKALRYRSVQYETLLNQAPIGVFLLDSDLIIREINPIAAPIFGDVPDGLVGRGFDAVIKRLVPPTRAADLLGLFRHTLETGEPQLPSERAEFRIDRGVTEYYEWRLDRITLSDGSFGVVCYFRDIADEVQARQERQQLLESERAARMEAEKLGVMKDEFLANLSHELRTPLTAILGWTHLLHKNPENQEYVTKGLEVIDRNARVQAQLIADLLDLSRFMAGKLKLDIESVDLPQVVEAALESLRPTADAKGVRVQTLYQPLEGVVHGDPRRLQQIVWNLLSNALKFTPRGGEVEVAVAPIDSDVQVTVRDTGRGIRKEFLPHLFERFRQQDASPARSQGGLGIGLALVKQLTELHGGTITAESDGEGYGATFTVRLPALTPGRARAADTTRRFASSTSNLAEADLPRLAGVRILVVEDDADTREVLRRFLQENDARVLVASSADEALRSMADDKLDILLCDIGMPEKDGYQLMRAIRAAGITTPAIAVTAFARLEDRTRALLAGYQAHVAKPVEPLELLVTIGSLVRRSRGPEPSDPLGAHSG